MIAEIQRAVEDTDQTINSIDDDNVTLQDIINASNSIIESSLTIADSSLNITAESMENLEDLVNAETTEEIIEATKHFVDLGMTTAGAILGSVQSWRQIKTCKV